VLIIVPVSFAGLANWLTKNGICMTKLQQKSNSLDSTVIPVYGQ